MGVVADELREEIASLQKQIRDLRAQQQVNDARLNERAKTADEMVRAVFASGRFEALLSRMHAIEINQTEISRRLMTLENARREAKRTEADDPADFEDNDYNEDDDL